MGVRDRQMCTQSLDRLQEARNMFYHCTAEKNTFEVLLPCHYPFKIANVCDKSQFILYAICQKQKQNPLNIQWYCNHVSIRHR